MGVAGDRGVGPDLIARFVDAQTRQAQRDRHVDVGGEFVGGVADRALEQLFRGVQPHQVDALLLHPAGLLEPGGGLVGAHDDRPQVAFGGGHRVQADQGARRHDDGGAGFAGPVDQVHVMKKLADRKRHQDAALFHGRAANVEKVFRRRAFDDHIGDGGQLGQFHHRGRRLQIGQAAGRPFLVAGRYGDQLQARLFAGIKPFHHRQTDGAQAAHGDPQGGILGILQ